MIVPLAFSYTFVWKEDDLKHVAHSIERKILLV